MKKIIKTAIALSVVFAFMFGCSNASKTDPSNSTSPEEKVVTVEGTNWDWVISQPTIKAGDPVKIVAKSVEGMHAFIIEGTDVNLMMPPSKEVSVIFTPNKPGEYKVICSIPCGVGHDDMVATIKVD